MRKKLLVIFLLLIFITLVSFGSTFGVYAETLESSTLTFNLRSEFKTPILNKSEERVHNIKRALSTVNGKVMKCEDSFSFNELTGLRTKENGYRESIIIFNGEYTKGFGGGVCQVSTTLYNALILSDVFINEVHSHTIKPSYVEMSFDAMVNVGTHDLRWTNTTGCDLLIKAFVEDGFVVVKIFGEKMDCRIRRVSKVVKIIQPKEEAVVDIENKFSNWTDEEESIVIKKAIMGYKTQGQLQYYRNNRVIKVKNIRTDYYSPVDGLIAKNPNVRNGKNDLNFKKLNGF